MKFIKNLIYKYVDWERTWYNPNPKLELKKGDKVKLNWKAKSHLGNIDINKGIMIFDNIDENDVVEMESGECYNLYWLKRA